MIDEASVILRADHISKSFGAVTALTDVSMYLRRGEVLGLVGDNGAGKSTLIKIICGFHKPDSGTLIFEGQPLSLNSPIEARNLGIQTVYQDLALVNHLTVYHNMFLGREPLRRVLGLQFLDHKLMREQTRTYLDTLGIRIPNVSELGCPTIRRATSVHRGGALHLFQSKTADSGRTTGRTWRARGRARTQTGAGAKAARRCLDYHHCA